MVASKITLKQLEEMDCNFFDVRTIAGFMGVDPQHLRTKARQAPELLGFRCTIYGSQVLFPKIAFIAWYKGEKI